MPPVSAQDTAQGAAPGTVQTEPSEKLGSLSAIGAIAGGLFASSCCILPLVLVSLGIGGAWMSNLTALSPYQPYFIALAAVSVGGGFWLRFRARRSACALDGPCAQTQSQKRYVWGLWAGAVLAVGAMAFNFIVPLFY